LDPEEAQRLRELLAALPPSATLLISSHILSEVHDLTDELIVLAHGRLAAKAAWSDLLGQQSGDPQSLRALYLKLTESEGAAQ
jgi:ABC-type multidrug transport system ATPase subunit